MIFLASVAGSFVTGQTLAVDGGVVALPRPEQGQRDSTLLDAFPDRRVR